MKTRMKIGQIVQMNLASIGYRVDQRPFHEQQMWLLLERMLILILQFVHVLHVANTPGQYMETIFMIMTGVLMYISSVSTIMEMENIFIFIDHTEQIINEREYLSVFFNSQIHTHNVSAPFQVFWSS